MTPPYIHGYQSRESIRLFDQAQTLTQLLDGDAAYPIFALPFDAESFDHVFVCFLLEHLPRPLEALAILKRLLRPGGTITVIEGDHGSAYFQPARARGRLYPKDVHGDDRGRT